MRTFSFKILVFVAGLFTIGCSSTGLKKVIPEYGGLSVLQGHTTDNTTQFSVVVPTDTVYDYIIQPEAPGATDKSGTPPDIVISAERTMRTDSSWAVDSIIVSGLKPGAYVLFIRNAETKMVAEKRYFETLNPTQKFDFIVASCLDDSYPEIQQSIWPQIMTHDPDAIFMIGDNVYADKYLKYKGATPPAEVWKRYVETRKRIDVFFWERLVPIYATWDDHDYGENDGNRKYPYKDKSLQIFETFFAQKPDERFFKKGPGVAFSWDIFEQRFIFLDGRSFQSAPEDVDKKLFGVEQETWAFAAATQPAAMVWFINGLQFFGGYHRFESFEGSFKDDFAAFNTKLREVKNRFVLISGDRHLFEAMAIPASEVGQDTYELTSSGIHAKMYPGGWDVNPNPRQIAGVALKPNYLLIKTIKRDNKIVPTVEALSINESLFKKEL
jgi:alkaline phosphatase D